MKYQININDAISDHKLFKSLTEKCNHVIWSKRLFYLTTFLV